jgi:hypothetical protein
MLRANHDFNLKRFRSNYKSQRRHSTLEKHQLEGAQLLLVESRLMIGQQRGRQ